MEAFDIEVTLEGKPARLHVEALAELRDDKQQYKIYQGGEFLGTVWPDCLDHGVCWFSSDQFSEDTVIKIGDAIERYEC